MYCMVIKFHFLFTFRLQFEANMQYVFHLVLQLTPLSTMKAWRPHLVRTAKYSVSLHQDSTSYLTV